MTTLTTKKLDRLIADGDLTGEIKRLHTVIERIGAGNHELLIQIADTLERAERAEAENAALRDELDELAGQLALTVKELFETEDRTEAAKADNAALRKAFFWNYKSRRQRRDAMDAAMREGNGPMPERIALRYEYREGEGMRPALQKVIDDFNLDIRDPFTKLLVALLAGKEGK